MFSGLNLHFATLEHSIQTATSFPAESSPIENAASSSSHSWPSPHKVDLSCSELPLLQH